MKPLLEVSDICLSYHSISGETRVLSHISFSLFPGEFLAVVLAPPAVENPLF